MAPPHHRHKDSKGLWGQYADTPTDAILTKRVDVLETRVDKLDPPIVTPPPVDPPPVEPPPGGIEVKPGSLKQAIADAVNGDVLLLRGGDHLAPFLIVKKKITLQNWPGEKPVLTAPGRPDFLYFESDGVARGLTFKSQSTGFDDTQGAALSETRSPTSNIGLVWYDDCDWIGTAKMASREQLLYLADKGNVIQEIRITGGSMDMANGAGYGVHPYAGPSPKVITISGTAFRNFKVNAAVTNWANACFITVDRCSFANVVTVARGQYSKITVSNSWGKVSNPYQGNVVDAGGNDWTKLAA